MRRRSTIAATDPNVTIFIWFIIRDDPTSAWQSGLLSSTARRSRHSRRRRRVAAAFDGRNPQIFVKGGAQSPVVKVAALELGVALGAGAKSA